jgi:predicted transcriptional regulator
LEFGFCWSLSMEFISKTARHAGNWSRYIFEVLSTINSKERKCIKIWWKINILYNFQIHVCKMLSFSNHFQNKIESSFLWPINNP